MIASPELKKKIAYSLWRNNNVEAVRLLRQTFGWDLISAVRFLDEEGEHFKREYPEFANVPALPDIVPVDQALIARMQLSSSGEVLQLNKQLSEIEKLLYGWNYEVWLEATVVDGCGSRFPGAEAILKGYPHAMPSVRSFIPTSTASAKLEVEPRLLYEGDSGAGVDLSGEKGKLLKRKLPLIWASIHALVDLETADVYECTSEEGMPTPVFWGFRYLFYSSSAGRCLIFVCAASD